MDDDLAKNLKKQISELEAKGANRSKHEDLTLRNNKMKMNALERAMKDAGK